MTGVNSANRLAFHTALLHLWTTNTYAFLSRSDTQPSWSPFLSWTSIFIVVNAWEMPFLYNSPLSLFPCLSPSKDHKIVTFCRIYLRLVSQKQLGAANMPCTNQCRGSLSIDFTSEFTGRPGVLLRCSWPGTVCLEVRKRKLRRKERMQSGFQSISER